MLINLEGIDGCGKSTQSQFLIEEFEKNDEKTILLKEPTNGKYGKKLWEMLRGKRKANTDLFLFHRFIFLLPILFTICFLFSECHISDREFSRRSPSSYFVTPLK